MRPLFPQYFDRHHSWCVIIIPCHGHCLTLCFLGIGIIYVILQVVTYLLTEKLHWKGFQSGVYGTPPSLNYWFRQAAVYVFALTTMKLLVVALFAALPAIFDLGEWLLTFLGPSDAAQVILYVTVWSHVQSM